MAGETIITLVGNLTDDPELRFTPSGAPVANFRVASTPRTFDRQSGEWRDGDPLFLSCSVWRQAAENAAESLQRGMRVVVTGRLKQRSYETRDGQQRTVVELDVDEIGPSLRYATAKVTKTQRSGGGFGGGAPAAPAGGDPWSTAPAGPPAGGQAPGGQAPASGQAPGGQAPGGQGAGGQAPGGQPASGGQADPWAASAPADEPPF